MEKKASKKAKKAKKPKTAPIVDRVIDLENRVAVLEGLVRSQNPTSLPPPPEPAAT